MKKVFWLAAAMLLLCFAFVACGNGGGSRDAAEPDILSQPRSSQYIIGDTAQPLSVLAESPDGGILEYQWFRANSESGDGVPIPNADGNYYTPVIPKPGLFLW